MLKKPITYTDYNGIERTEDFYFNLTKAELMEMELSITGGLSEWITRISNEQNMPEIVKLFKKLILTAYGIKSADGKRFEKSEQISNEFAQTEAYSVLFMELAQDADAAAKFVNGIIPANMEAARPAIAPAN